MKIKIQLILLFTIATLSTLSGYSQKGNSEKIKTLKIAYLTEQLELTSDEAEKFWPIYNKYQNKIHELRKSEKKHLKKQVNDDHSLNSITNNEAEELLNYILKTQDQIQKERSKMFNELKLTIPAKKTLKLLKAEKDFNKKILEQYRKQNPKHIK